MQAAVRTIVETWLQGGGSCRLPPSDGGAEAREVREARSQTPCEREPGAARRVQERRQADAVGIEHEHLADDEAPAVEVTDLLVRYLVR